MIAGNFKTDRRLMTRVHFNRIEMQRGGRNVWTVHNSLGCFQVQSVIIKTLMYAVYRPKANQPRAYFKGSAKVEIYNGVAELT